MPPSSASPSVEFIALWLERHRHLKALLDAQPNATATWAWKVRKRVLAHLLHRHLNQIPIEQLMRAQVTAADEEDDSPLTIRVGQAHSDDAKDTWSPTFDSSPAPAKAAGPETHSVRDKLNHLRSLNKPRYDALKRVLRPARRRNEEPSQGQTAEHLHDLNRRHEPSLCDARESLIAADWLVDLSEEVPEQVTQYVVNLSYPEEGYALPNEDVLVEQRQVMLREMDALMELVPGESVLTEEEVLAILCGTTQDRLESERKKA